ncbi:MAG: hypothetical protein COA38_09290 [Fluviicola sp.]|nr:MAG: hypothetical protein COA38_09290 [Fluviicola sp.]
MRSVLLLIVLTFVFVSCESTDTTETISENLVVSESLIDSRFQECYYEDDLAKGKSDSILNSIFGKAIFNRNIRLSSTESMMNCALDNTIILVPFGDTNYCVPNSYDLLYSIHAGGKNIYSFRMVSGKDMQFEPVSTIVADQLQGYRNLLDGQFKISYSQARIIAKSNGVSFEDSNLELVKNESAGQSTYHWEAELEYDHNSVVLLLIDAMTGATSEEVLTIENIQ